MTLTAYRLTKTRYAEQAFSGEGARLTGGRWNPIETRMVYLASSLSLATLEMLVHIEDYGILMNLFSVIEVQFDSRLVHSPKHDDLPPGWGSPGILASTQFYGAEWLRSQSSVILQVPSVITPSENNFLLNPNHPSFKKVKIGKAKPFHFDPRLIKS